MPYTLPHQVSSADRTARQEQLIASKKKYQYHTGIGQSQHIRAPKIVPKSETFPEIHDRSLQPPVPYLPQMANRVAKITANVMFNAFLMLRAANVRQDTLGDLQTLEDQLADDPTLENVGAYYAQLSSTVSESGTKRDLNEYLDLHHNWSTNGIRGQGTEFLSDELFAQQAVAGPCPNVIKRVSLHRLNEYRVNGFPVTDDIFLANSPFTRLGDTQLDKMALEGRLYVQDFSMIAHIPAANPGALSQEKRFVFSPISLYAVTRDADPRLLPIAIQMRQNDRDPNHWDPIFVPHMPNAMAPDADESTADWSWEVAKAAVGSASQIHHEHYEHLGLAHYLMEAVTLVTQRCLPRSHPVFALLEPHLLGTLAINNFARMVLVNDWANLDIYISCDIGAFRQAAAKSIYETDLLARTPAIDLANRDVADLPYYPYRDDILLYWNAIHQYVREFLSVYYVTPNDLAQDMNISNGGELGGWWHELTADLDIGDTSGSLRGLNFGRLDTLDDLVKVVTFIIYSASAHHAAVNYPQGPYFSNPLICPATVSRPTPVPGKTNKDYFVEFLPPKYQAMMQMNVMMTLASFYFTKLGRFADDAFDDPRVEPAIQHFQAALEEIRVTVEARNAHLPEHLKYNYLHPDFVPQSTNL